MSNYSKSQAKNSSYTEKYYRKQLYREMTQNPDLFSDFQHEYRSADLFNDILAMRMQNLVVSGTDQQNVEPNQEDAIMMGQGLT